MASRTAAVSISPRRAKGGLFRRFILPQIVITAVAGTIVLIAAGKGQRSQERERLMEVVASNARITDELAFPRSVELASKLSEISGRTVIFSGTQGELISSTSLNEDELAAARLAVSGAPKAIRHRGYGAAANLLKSGNESLVIVQAEKNLWALASGNAALWPVFGSLLLAIGAAFLIARTVVKPLQEIAFHLDEDSSDESLAIPTLLLERSDEIGLLARSLVMSREALLKEQDERRRVQHLALLGELTTSLAHEIKNPASAILMHAQALEKYHQDATGTLIKEEGERIVSLVNQWLFVVKPEAPRLTSNNVTAIVQRLREKLQALLDFHSVTLEIEAPENVELLCDAPRIEHLFRNLIDNAIQAMPTGGSIFLKLSAIEGRILFEVRDEGRGFSKAALHHFGEAFYSEREGGMGLGLALVAGVTRAHGGEVRADGIPSGGAIVSGYFSTQTSKG